MGDIATAYQVGTMTGAPKEALFCLYRSHKSKKKILKGKLREELGRLNVNTISSQIPKIQSIINMGYTISSRIAIKQCPSEYLNITISSAKCANDNATV